MNKLGIFLSSVCAAGALTLSSRDAHALGPIGIELGAKVGYGSNPDKGAPNALDLGLGGRGGVSIFGLYAGVAGLYYLGSSETVMGQKVSDHSAVYGFEAGYGFKLLGLLTIRPQVGVGNDQISEKVTESGMTLSNGSKGYLYIEPAALVMISIGIVYIGADVGGLLLPSGPAKEGTTCSDPTKCHSFDAALTVHGQVGVSF